MRPVIALALLASLCACQPQDPDGQAAIPPADAPPPAPEAAAAPAVVLPTEFSGDLDAVGTEPFWSLAIRKDTLTLSRPDAPDLIAPAGPPRMQGASAVWTSPAMTVTLSKADCSDGMSDRKFPFAAQVRLGANVLDGCAAGAAGARPSAASDK